jgi:hypothetical protein
LPDNSGLTIQQGNGAALLLLKFSSRACVAASRFVTRGSKNAIACRHAMAFIKKILLVDAARAGVRVGVLATIPYDRFGS